MTSMTGSAIEKIDRAFDETINRILERLFAQADEAVAVVFKMGDRVTQFFLQVAHDQEAHAELIAGADDVARRVVEAREFEHDDLGDFEFPHDRFDLIARAENVDALGSFIDRLVGQEAEGAEADLGLAPDPGVQFLRPSRRSRSGASSRCARL